jgi:hypothetical protein
MASSKKRKDRSGGDGQDARGMKRSKVRPSLVPNFQRQFSELWICGENYACDATTSVVGSVR